MKSLFPMSVPSHLCLFPPGEQCYSVLCVPRDMLSRAVRCPRDTIYIELLGCHWHRIQWNCVPWSCAMQWCDQSLLCICVCKYMLTHTHRYVHVYFFYSPFSKPRLAYSVHTALPCLLFPFNRPWYLFCISLQMSSILLDGGDADKEGGDGGPLLSFVCVLGIIPSTPPLWLLQRSQQTHDTGIGSLGPKVIDDTYLPLEVKKGFSPDSF